MSGFGKSATLCTNQKRQGLPRGEEKMYSVCAIVKKNVESKLGIYLVEVKDAEQSVEERENARLSVTLSAEERAENKRPSVEEEEEDKIEQIYNN